jgi:cell division protein FtsQ
VGAAANSAAVSSERRSRARVAVVPSQRRGVLSAIGPALPSGRSLAVGFAVLAVGLGGYAAARETSLFAVQTIEVRGAPAHATRRIETALEPLAGQSLLELGAGDVDRALTGLPDVQAVSLDRSFPRTLVVKVIAERPAAVLRRGSESWLISEQGRVLSELTDEQPPKLPRIWVDGIDTPRDGALLGEEEALRPALALGRILVADRRFLWRVREARAVGADVHLVLKTGTEVRLGSIDDLAVKIAVARQVLATVPEAEGGYVDVSVPERTVARLESQLSG